MQVLLTISNLRIMINADENVNIDDKLKCDKGFIWNPSNC